MKAKSWDDRMEKTKKELAIKKIQLELKAEKQAEITRYVKFIQLTMVHSQIFILNRRREVTLERKKAAEERRRFEEEKVKVGAISYLTCS